MTSLPVSYRKSEWKNERHAAHMQREGTYSGSLHRPTVHIGHSRTGLDWALPVAKEGEEQLRDRATAVVRLQGGKRGGGEEKQETEDDKFHSTGGNEDRCRNKEERNNTDKWNAKKGLNPWGWWDTYPTGAAPLTLCKEQGGTLQHCPRGGPVLPVCHNTTRTLCVSDFRQLSKKLIRILGDLLDSYLTFFPFSVILVTLRTPHFSEGWGGIHKRR